MTGTQFIKNQITRFLAPSGIKRIGAGSRIRRPRKIDGAHHIEIGANTLILPYGWISAIEAYQLQRFDPKLCIGNNVYIGHNACITCIDSVVIEDDCVLSDGVYIADSAHGYNPENGPIMKQPLTSKGPVRIGAGGFLGFRSIIMPGVTLGNCCVVGCNTVVMSSFPAYSMLVGSPARCVKKYSFKTHKWESIGQDESSV